MKMFKMDEFYFFDTTGEFILLIISCIKNVK